MKKVKTPPIIQENTLQCIDFIENSFLKGLFTDSVTDIYYNGKNLFAQDNWKGRYFINRKVDGNEVYELIRHIANSMLKNFSISSPILDVAFGNYRLSAVHPSLARYDNKKVTTFSLRKIAPILQIKENDTYLAPLEVIELLKCLVKTYQSILISGATGSGKTELQKFLVSFMNENDRIILIEESYETYLKEIFPNRDITSWIISNQNGELSTLIRLALRNNPDWIIIAETRGKEAYDMIHSVLTGHPIITTIHSESAENNLSRIVQMCKKEIEFEETAMANIIAKHLKIGVHIEKIFDTEKNIYIRRIREIVEYIPENFGYTTHTLYDVYQKKWEKASLTLNNEVKKHGVFLPKKWRLCDEKQNNNCDII